jgi:hypothetical protein
MTSSASVRCSALLVRQRSRPGGVLSASVRSIERTTHTPDAA